MLEYRALPGLQPHILESGFSSLPMNFARPSPTALSVLLWGFVVLACIARFVHLDSDPKIEHWVYYVMDEGLWVETARNLALFDQLRLYGTSQLHLSLTPSFQALTYVVFEFAGVGFWSARVLPATCGAAIVIVSFLFLRRIASGVPLYLGLAVLAFEPLTLSISRTAVPEIPSLLFTLLAFVAICTARNHIRGAAIGGLFMAIAISMKATTVLMTPPFLLIVALSGSPASVRERLLKCLAFLLVLLIPAVGGLALALAGGIVDTTFLSRLVPLLWKMRALGNTYTIASRFVTPDTAYGNLALLLLGAWVCSWVLIFRKEYRGTLLGKAYELSGIWAAGWLIVYGSIGYTPPRYSVHCIVPLAIHLTAGLGLWQTIGPARVVAGMNKLLERGGIAIFGWLVLPTAVILSMLIAALGGLAGLPFDRISYRLVAFVTIAALLATLARAGRRRDERAVTGFIAIPVAAALLGTAIDQIGMLALSRSAADLVLPLANFVVFGAIAWYSLAGSISIAGFFERTSAKALSCALALTVLLVQCAPELLQPTYSIRDASRYIARLFANARLLHSAGAGSLFLETKIPYRETVGRRDTVSDGILNYNRSAKPGPEFELVTIIPLVVHPRYQPGTRTTPLMRSGAALVEVYRNVQPQQLAPPLGSSMQPSPAPG